MDAVGLGDSDGTGAEKRVLVAGLVHQTNTLVGGRTSLEDLEVRRGGEMLRTEDGAPPIAGVLEVAREKGWQILPVLDMRATPGPTVADAVVDLFWAEFKTVADREAGEGVDGIFLVLHGSTVSESLPDWKANSCGAYAAWSTSPTCRSAACSTRTRTSPRRWRVSPTD